MFRAVHKIMINGTSSVVVIPRPLMFSLAVSPGSLVLITENEDQSFTVRPWRDETWQGHKGPGVLSPDAPAGK